MVWDDAGEWGNGKLISETRRSWTFSISNERCVLVGFDVPESLEKWEKTVQGNLPKIKMYVRCSSLIAVAYVPYR